LSGEKGAELDNFENQSNCVASMDNVRLKRNRATHKTALVHLFLRGPGWNPKTA
jgi:hypothetical protein